MKQNMDERQRMEMNKTGMISFYIMFGVCVAVIVVQMIWKGSLEVVLGETLVFLAGGISCLMGSIKNGYWTLSGEKMTLKQNLLLSVVCSGIFSVLYAVIIIRKANEVIWAVRAVVLFFIGVAVLGFITLSLVGKMAQYQKEQRDKKYSE